MYNQLISCEEANLSFADILSKLYLTNGTSVSIRVVIV